MNKFQAIAQIMAILCEGGRLQKGSLQYKIARKLITKKIDIMGPDAAFAEAKWAKHGLLAEIELLHTAEKAGKILRPFV